MKILHITTALDIGGAEMMLYRLLSAMDRAVFEPEVISLKGWGIIAEKISDLGIPVYSLNMNRGLKGILSVNAFWELRRLVNGINPDIIQTWMYHSDFLGSIVAKISGNIPVVWGVHHTSHNIDKTKKTTIYIARICSKVSRNFPRKVICCSFSAKDFHESLGYDAQKLIVIPNGFDVTDFKSIPHMGFRLREELGILEEEILVGNVARFNPQKDHQNFLEAAVILRKEFQNIRFLLCGRDMNWGNKNLVKWINEKEMEKFVYLLGERNDIPAVMNALDIFVSSSYSEAFPLVIGEAMACEVPCVVTDVGDSAYIVGETGIVVPPENPQVLASGIKGIIEMDVKKKKDLGRKARERIEKNFSLALIASKYEEVYRDVMRCF